jgi:methionyl-tRNA formyltransferase
VRELLGPEPRRALGDEAVDLIVVASFSRILRAPLIGLPRLGAINVHPSLLPRLRGPTPLYWALANGERVTGVNIHHLDAGIDTGDVIAQRELAIRPGETLRSLHARAVALAAALLRETLPRLADRTAPRIPQDESLASYYSFPPPGSDSLF